VVRASLVGTTATGVNLSAAKATEDAGALADELGVPVSDVRLRPATSTVEVYDANVSESALAGALDDLGFVTPGLRTRAGVTDETQQATVRTLEARLDVLGIDATVEAATVDGRRGVAVTPTDGNASAVRDAVRDRGRVEIVAHFPADGSGEPRSVTLLENADFERVGTAQAGRQNPYVPVTVAEDAAGNFSSALVGFGFTDEGVGDCPTDAATADPANASGHCLYTVHDGDVVYAASLSAGLADAIESGEWEASPRFVMTAVNESAARELQAHLEAGALPTRLSIPD
jgi:preprotein translocase subunit SecD